MNWRKIRIGDFLHRVRIPVDIEDDQQYNLVTIRMHHKGVALRATKPGKEIGTKRMYAVQPGHFILSGIDARHGAFGIVPSELAGAVVTNDFWYFEVDDKQVDKELFLHLTSTSFFDDLCRIASDGTTNRVRLQADKFFNYEISLPPVEEQRELMAQLKHTNTVVTSVLAETDNQLTYLTHLRQALLREAMQGQLLPQDPTDEPATLLLQKLQAAKTTAGKKGRDQAGALFAEDRVEGPYELPASWVWCTLEEICNQITDGAHHTPEYREIGFPFLSVKNISNGFIDFSNTKFITAEAHTELIKRCNPEFGDVLLTKIGTTGVAQIIDTTQPFSIFVSVCLLKFNQGLLDGKFLELLLNSPFVKKQSLDGTWGVGNKNLVLKTIKKFVLCLPPLAEQRRIVAKLEQLLGRCDALEQRIRESRRVAEQLLATALREALAPPAVAALPAAAELELAEATQAPARRASRRGTQLALGTLLD